MKKFTYLLFIYFFGLSAYATNYYVSKTTGNDNNTGTSPEKAWATLAKVQSMGKTFLDGDVIFFTVVMNFMALYIGLILVPKR